MAKGAERWEIELADLKAEFRRLLRILKRNEVITPDQQRDIVRTTRGEE